jgi:hypothetical protein
MRSSNNFLSASSRKIGGRAFPRDITWQHAPGSSMRKSLDLPSLVNKGEKTDQQQVSRLIKSN